MTSPRTDRLPGTLDLLVLRILAREQMHGWAIAQLVTRIRTEVSWPVMLLA